MISIRSQQLRYGKCIGNAIYIVTVIVLCAPTWVLRRTIICRRERSTCGEALTAQETCQLGPPCWFNEAALHAGLEAKITS